ncbi:MAG: HEAT repeat domain-containing protein [Chloroflexi bacterium]|nr:MAG: HEAT repeat domain-containing protein [Chloroflexota bacterium]HDN80278.1 HEAT repeat domain-containing protein [Chloroflexota bacterium]
MDAKKVKQWSKQDKLRLLEHIVNGEDYWQDFSPVLEELIDDEDPEIRAMAVRGLWNYPHPRFIDRLLELSLKDPSQEVRSQAILTLGRYIYEGEMSDYDFEWEGPIPELLEPELPIEDFLRVKNFLLTLFRDESQPIESRRYAVEALGFLSDPEVLEIIETAYNHPDRRMKISALFAMGRNGHKRWHPIILKELENPDYEIRYEAVRAAGEAYIEEATPILIDIACFEKDKDLRMEAIWALGKTGGEEAESVLIYLISDDPDKDIREVAEAALEELHIYDLDSYDLEEFPPEYDTW